MARSRRAMVLEGLLRAFWPLAAFLAAAWAAFAFGIAEALTRPQMLAALGALGLAALGLALWGLRHFRWPSRAAARARLDAGLPGRPLETLEDRPAIGRDDPGAQAVWAAHRARMARIAATARALRPDLRLAARDPWALRLAALVAVVAALVFARDPAVESVSAALAPDAAANVAAGPSYEGWAEPPVYSGRPTLYLSEVSGAAPVSLPQGTRITLRVYGSPESFDLSEAVSGSSARLAEAAPGIACAEFELARDGSVTLRRGDGPLAEWTFLAEPDAAPTITLAEPVAGEPMGETRIVYRAEDDYGIVGARAEIALDLDRVDRRYGLRAAPEERPALAVELPLPMARTAAEVEETLVEDFSQHPWAGLPVTIRLTAEDAIGQTGVAEGIATILPGRRFYDPLAAALIEQRRDLLWSEANAWRVLQVLRAVSYRPETVFDNTRAYLVMRMALRRLAGATEAGTVPSIRDEVAEALWLAAVLLEDGNLGDAAERLARAKERLAEALRNDASDEEIARLMDELRDATRDYMEQLAREAIERGQTQQAERQQGQPMSQDQIQALMDRIQELSEQGRKAEAEALLEMLQQMLENMEMQLAEGQSGSGEGSPGQQSMQGLADALREQQGLADESFQQLQREFRQGQLGQGMPEGEPDEGGAGEGPMDLAQRQEALRQLMDALRDGLPGAAGDAVREALREAERNMGEARDGLEEGDTSGALDRQAEAIDDLREGMRALGEDLRRAEAGGDQQGAASGQASADRSDDPLGRPVGTRGSLGTNQRLLPEADAAARARAILDEIRRRAGDLGRPELELDYLRRLLDQF
ncbi:TIGR02302 family protein [Amaricoccus sp.]|uniref:TIGR02302 family protein n=1 Tax=Amaricoccus sp. TaxID=1872485 RepID=UPI002BBB6D86|nr:TIGR02302 family protein [Amaricoccus sp.]HMQ93441.1 TIGR02302 family protein [Amaricoccus sp.]